MLIKIWMLHSSTWNKELRKLTKLYCIVLLSTFFTQSVFAVDYYWAPSGPGRPDVDPRKAHANTPWHACQNRLDLYQNAFRPGHNAHVTRIKYLTQSAYKCWYNYYYFDTRTGEWTLAKEMEGNSFSATRYGKSCPTGSTTNPTTGGCEKDEQKGPAPQSCGAGESVARNTSFAGNPINFSIGNKYQAEIDYSIRGDFALNLSRSYNSLDGLWRHSYSAHLRFAGTEYVAVVTRNGRESFFTLNGTTITPTSADLGVLSKTTIGWQFISTDNERFTFDTAGNLTHWSNTNGASQQFVRNGNQVTVTDNLGNSLSFTEDADRQPLSMTAPGVQITYAYNADKRLNSVSSTVGGITTQRQYHYEDARNNTLLTGITDERGVRYATWSYDDQGRAISSEHAAGAERVTVTYNSNDTVSVTNELGKVANYSFQYIKGVKRITAIDGEPSPNCPSSNSTFTYDERGLLKTKTDNKGHLTTYTYNARGLEVSRTEASGTAQARTITTDWHADLFLPVTVTEPDRIIQYTYDNHGRQISQTVSQR